MSATKLETSAVRAQAARAQLLDTAHEIQARLDPSQLLDDAVETVKTGATTLANETAGAVRRRPAVAAGGAALIAALLARKPLRRLGGRLRRKGTD